MAQILTAVNIYGNTIVVPEDGDDADALSLSVGFQALLNNDGFLNAVKVDGVTGGTYSITGDLIITAPTTKKIELRANGTSGDFARIRMHDGYTDITSDQAMILNGNGQLILNPGGGLLISTGALTGGLGSGTDFSFGSAPILRSNGLHLIETSHTTITAGGGFHVVAPSSDVTGSLSVTGLALAGTLATTGNASVAGTLTVTTGSELSGPHNTYGLSSSFGNAHFWQDVQIDGELGLSGLVEFFSIMKPAATGAIAIRHLTAPDADLTIDWGNTGGYELVYVPVNTNTTLLLRTYSLDSGGIAGLGSLYSAKVTFINVSENPFWVTNGEGGDIIGKVEPNHSQEFYYIQSELGWRAGMYAGFSSF